MNDIKILPLSALVESPTNPRKTHNTTGLQQMAESIKQVGVMQPILVRPIAPFGDDTDPLYEIVFGHRRFKASQMAGVETIRAMVREMDNDDVKIAQLIENVQREDVNPVEEADGFLALHRQHSVSADDIASQTGLSRTQVYDRMKLARAHDAVRLACLEQALPADIGVAIARLPMAIQPKALSDVEDGDGGWMPVRQAKAIIKAGFTVSLKGAIFDLHQADMVTVSCDQCPKRSDNDESYLEQLGADVCTDKACFKTKEGNHVQAKVDEAEALGHKVVKGDAAKRIQSPYASHPIGHAKLDDVAFTEKGAEGEADKHVTYRELVEQDEDVKPILLVNPQRSALAPAATLDLITHEQAQALKQKFSPTAPDESQVEEEGDDDDDDSMANDPPEVQAVANHRGWRAIVRAIVASLRATKRTPAELKLVILAMMYYFDDVPEVVAEAWGWTAELEADDPRDHSEFVREKIEAMSPDDLASLMVALALDAQPLRFNEDGIADKLALAGAYGIDVLKVTGWKPPANQGALSLEAEGEAAQPAPTNRPVALPPSVKYRNAFTGETWSGRGLQPKWVQVAIASGKTLADFEVERAAA